MAQDTTSLDPPVLNDLLSPDFARGTAVKIPDGGPLLTYAELREQVSATARALRGARIRPADRVAVVLPAGLEFLVTFLAVTWARAVAAPLNPAYTSGEFEFFLRDCAARGVVLPPGDHPARRAASRLDIPAWDAALDGRGRVQLAGLSTTGPAPGEDTIPRPDDVALFLHTSGTTSRPKGVPLTHANLMASLSSIARTYGLSPEDTSLAVMPAFHVHGLLGVILSTLRSGGTVVIPARFSARTFWRHVCEHRVSWYSAVPTIHRILLSLPAADPPPRHTLRFIRSCSSALPPSVMAALEDRFGVPVTEAYGMTEASHQVASNRLPPGLRKSGSVGAATGVAVAILDEGGEPLPPGELGEVAIRGPSVMRGYHSNPEANAAAFAGGWFRTGDQGLLDADEYLTLTGRLKELINRGGEKISPLEIDAVLLRHPAVADAVTFAAPDAKYGEEVCAAVVLRADVSERDLIAFCGDHLAAFKCPKVIYVARELPRTATGKIQRRQMASHFLK